MNIKTYKINLFEKLSPSSLCVFQFQSVARSLFWCCWSDGAACIQKRRKVGYLSIVASRLDDDDVEL